MIARKPEVLRLSGRPPAVRADMPANAPAPETKAGEPAAGVIRRFFHLLERLGRSGQGGRDR